MAENVGSVFWEVEVDTSGMLRGVRQMDRQLDDFNGQLNETSQGIRRAFNPARIRRLAGGVAKAVGAATLAFTAFAAAIGNSAKELEVMSRQAGVTIEQFQAIQFATEKYTVSGEQFADITKDMSDKLGEFAAVGTGPFQDYIDVMKLTKDQGRDLANQLQELAGPQAIQFLVSEMESAEVSGAQMTFVLESMGNDLSKLIPLFAQGGKELQELSKKFEDVSGAISADTFKEYKELSGNMGLATTSFKTFLAEALSPLIPAFDAAAVSIAKFFSELTNSTKEGKKAADINERIAEIIGEQINARGRVTKIASEEAKEINRLLILNEELDSKINKRITAVGRSAEAARKEQRVNSVAWKAEIEANDKIIEQLKAESAAAQEVFNIRKGIASVTAAPSAGGGTNAPQTPFTPTDFGGSGDSDIVSKAGGVQDGEFGSFGSGNPFNVQVINDDAEEILQILRDYETQKQEIMEGFESPAERAKRELDQRLAVINAAGETEKVTEAEIAQSKLNAHKEYEEKKTQISKSEEDRRKQQQQLTLSQAGDFFGTMANLAVEGGEKSFKAWKAFAIAQAIISTSQAVMNAMANIPAPFNFAAAGAAGAMGAVQIAKIRGSQYSGRAQGGPVKAGNIYPVNEAGTEGFQFRSGGKDYLQPMTDGKVVKNSEMKKGGGGDSFSISNSYTIQAIDTTTATQFIEQNQEAVYQSVINAANERGGF